MSEWLFEAAGDGGLASSPQFWDIEKNAVRVGSARVPVAPDDPDFELLRAARASNGRFYPGPFRFSPQDGQPLSGALAPLPVAVGADGVLRLERASADFVSLEPSVVSIPADNVAWAGSPAIGFVCDFARGLAWRWSEHKRDWVRIGALPAGTGGASALYRSVQLPRGFAYASKEQAVGVAAPGPEGWQSVHLSPEGVMPLAGPVSHGESATLVGWTKEGLVQVSWTGAGEWQMQQIIGDGPAAIPDIAGLTSAFGGIGGLIGIGDGMLFQVTNDLRFVRREWPDGFHPLPGFVPVLVAGEYYVLGNAGDSEPCWVCMQRNAVVDDLLPAKAAATPIAEGFVSPEGLAAFPGGAVSSPLRLPQNTVGRALLRFDDAILFLAIDCGNLWPEALAGKRRRWRVRLVLCRLDGTVVDLPGEARLDRPGEVSALVTARGLHILGLRAGEALCWEADRRADTP